MQDLYLKFSNEAEARSVLYRKEGVVEADLENGIEAQEGYDVPLFSNIDHIGVIYKPTGKMLQTDEGEVPEMAPLDGYHVNVRVVGEDATALEPYKVEPKQPARGWA